MDVDYTRTRRPGVVGRADAAARELDVAPEFCARHQQFVARTSRGLRADPQLAWMCPLPKR